LVDQVREIRAGESRGRGRVLSEIDLRGDRDAFGVDPEDGFASTAIGQPNRYLPVEPARTQKRRIEDIGPVGRGQHDHRLAWVESIHLDQELVQRLLTLVVPAADTREPLAADSIELVDEDDRRRGDLRPLKEITNAAGSDTDEHLDEFG